MRCEGWTTSEHSDALWHAQRESRITRLVFKKFEGHGKNDVPHTGRTRGTYLVRLGFGNGTPKAVNKRQTLFTDAFGQKLKPFYPSGVAYTVDMMGDLEILPMPLSEFYKDQPPRERVTHYTARANGSPCWHVYGHYLAYLFKQNPSGKVYGAVRSYYGKEQFLKYSNTPPTKGPRCDCWSFNTDRFQEIIR